MIKAPSIGATVFWNLEFRGGWVGVCAKNSKLGSGVLNNLECGSMEFKRYSTPPFPKFLNVRTLNNPGEGRTGNKYGIYGSQTEF